MEIGDISAVGRCTEEPETSDRQPFENLICDERFMGGEHSNPERLFSSAFSCFQWENGSQRQECLNPTIPRRPSGRLVHIIRC